MGPLSCAGMLHCRYDNICVHPHHICDGVIHCHYSQDDELLCTVSVCPSGCQCVRFTAICNGTTPNIKEHAFHNFTSLYLENLHSGSGILLHFQVLEVCSIVNTSLCQGCISSINKFPLKHLTLENNNITFLKPFSFDNLHNVSSFKLVRNIIHFLESHTFSGMHNLQVLNLTNLEIRFIQYCCFCNMNSLQTIDLGRNQLETIDWAMFITTKPLTNINISNNTITAVKPADEWTMTYT